MADHVDEDYDGGSIFIYREGEAPWHITHARIDKSLDEIEEYAFIECELLVHVDTHDGIRRVGKKAFWYCTSLLRINIKFVFEINEEAFCGCENLESVEFGDRLETIGSTAFKGCSSLNHLKLPSIITIRQYAFLSCKRLTDVELSERLEFIGGAAFANCESLQRIVVPLKRDLFAFDDFYQRYTQFDDCEQLATVDLVGQAHTKTIASFHMESWKTEMSAEIDRINQVLPGTDKKEKTDTIQQWMESLLDKLDHYKAEHCRYIKEGATLLELALWKAKLDEKEEYAGEGKSKKVKVDAKSSRKEKRVTCGADTVIKNVLPFLQLE